MWREQNQEGWLARDLQFDGERKPDGRLQERWRVYFPHQPKLIYPKEG